MDEAKRSAVADNIIAAIIRDIRGRKGIGNEWEEIDVDVRNEIVATWRGLIVAYLPIAGVETTAAPNKVG